MGTFPQIHPEQREIAENAWELALDYIASNSLDDEDEAGMLQYLREVVCREGDPAFANGMHLLTALLGAPTPKGQ
jgi:hypothetical protein